MAEDKSGFDYNPQARIMRQVVLDDDQPEKLFLPWEQDVTELVDENHALEEAHSRHGADLRLAARIPIAEYLDLQRQGITQDPVAFKRWLNDPDRRKYRVWKGQL